MSQEKMMLTKQDIENLKKNNSPELYYHVVSGKAAQNLECYFFSGKKKPLILTRSNRSELIYYVLCSSSYF